MHNLQQHSREEGGKADAFAFTQSPPYLPHFLRIVNVDIIGPDSQVNTGF